MVFEQLVKTNWIIKKPEYALYLGVIFSIISFFTSFLLFSRVPNFIGISTILFTVIITVPTINKLLDYEEVIETETSIPFFKKHKSIIDFFIYFFIGVFIVFFITSLIFPGTIFSEQQLYGASSEIQKTITIRDINLPPPPASNQSGAVYSIFKNNVYVMIISFILSLFYGTGALFLIILNASVFAAALGNIVRIKVPEAFAFFSSFSFLACNLGIMFFHMIPEVGAYLLAAIAGGVLGKAALKEPLFSKNFNLVFKDAIILLLISFVVLYLAALIEIHISKKLFLANVCLGNTLLILLITIFLIVIVILLEFLRKKYISHKQE